MADNREVVMRSRESMTTEKREDSIEQVTMCQDGPVLLAEGAMALLLADPCAAAPPSISASLCGVQGVIGSRDGVMQGRASQAARDSSAPSAFFCLWPAGEIRPLLCRLETFGRPHQLLMS